jgi:hypothetical protein
MTAIPSKILAQQLIANSLGLPFCAGSIFYVQTGGTNSARNGRVLSSPLATIAYALTLCTAGAGDIIVLLPGHAETYSAAAGLAITKAGVTIIGVGHGTLRPRLTLDTATTTDIDIDAANVTMVGIDFAANFADIAVCLDVNADDFTLRDCRFLEAATNMNFLVCVQDAPAGGSDRITIEDCYAQCPDAANTHFVNFAGAGDGHVVRRNRLIGDWGTAAIGGAGVVTSAVITDNDICNKASDSDACINMAATATGICHRNMACGGAAQANGITATGMSQAENYYGVISEDLQAILDPIAT